MSAAVWRTADVNINRAGEGLRLLEDISRFILDDETVCKKLKGIRHYLATASAPWHNELISSRDSAGDLGREAGFDEAPKRENLISLARANSKRVQEALRSLEELAKLPGMDAALDWARLKEHRFTAYDIEKEIVSLLGRRAL